MKLNLKLNKKKLKNLSKDNQALPADMTPHIAGGALPKQNSESSFVGDGRTNCPLME